MWVCVGNKPSQTGLCLLYQLFIKLQMFNSYYCKKYNVYSIICAFVQMFMVRTRVSLVKLLYKYSINRQVVFGDFLPGIFFYRVDFSIFSAVIGCQFNVNFWFSGIYFSTSALYCASVSGSPSVIGRSLSCPILK